MRYLALVIPSMRYAVSQGYNRMRQEWAGLALGGLRWPLRHAAPRRAFGDRPLITCQGFRHALALLRLLLFRSPRHELLLLRELLLFPHGVPLRPLYRESIVALCPVLTLRRRARYHRPHARVRFIPTHAVILSR